MDRNEWIENSNFIVNYGKSLSNRVRGYFLDFNDEANIFIEEEFIFGFTELFKQIFKKFAYEEKLNFLFPLYYFSSMLEHFVESTKFQDISSKNKIGQFLIDYYILNKNFFESSFIQDDNVFITFGNSFLFEKSDIFNSLFFILEMLFKKSNYGNLTIANKINLTIDNLKENVEWNSLKHKIILHLSVLVLNMSYDGSEKYEPLKISSIDFIFSFLRHYASLPKDQRTERNHDLYLTLFIVQNLTINSIYSNYVLTVKTDILRFLHTFNKAYHSIIIDIMINFIFNVEYVKENFEYFSNIKKLEPSNYDDQLQVKVKQILHASNEKIIEKLKKNALGMDEKNLNHTENKGE